MRFYKRADWSHNNAIIIAFSFYPLIDHPSAMQILIDRLIDELFSGFGCDPFDLPPTTRGTIRRITWTQTRIRPEPAGDSDCPAIIQMKCRRCLWILLQILCVLSTTCTNYDVRLPRTGQAQLLPTHTHTLTHSVARVLDGLIELINDVAQPHCVTSLLVNRTCHMAVIAALRIVCVCLGCGTAWFTLLIYRDIVARPSVVHH